MATGENFMRIHWAKKQSTTVNQKNKAEIARLQKLDSELWANDSLDDNYVEQQSREYNNRIQQLINEA